MSYLDENNNQTYSNKNKFMHDRSIIDDYRKLRHGNRLHVTIMTFLPAIAIVRAHRGRALLMLSILIPLSH